VLRRRSVRILAYVTAGLVTLVGGVILAAILFVQGERLAGIVNGVLPEMKGKIAFKAIGWKPRLLVDLVADRPTPMVVEGLLITDPEGTTVLDVPRLEVSVRLGPLLSGGGPQANRRGFLSVGEPCRDAAWRPRPRSRSALDCGG